MSEITNIGWTKYTWSPWFGCRRVSPGCLHCYIEWTTPFRVRGLKHGDPRQRGSVAYWKQPLKWQRQQEDFDDPCPRVFPSLCDWLDDEVPLEWLADFLQLIHDTPNLDWLLLTKRPELWKKQVAKAWTCKMTHGDATDQRFGAAKMVESWLNGEAPHNAWIGTSIEDQKRDYRIQQVLQIPATIRFLSVEPLLEPVKLGLNQINYDRMCHGSASQHPSIDWIIVGGESGGKRRDCGVEAIVDVANQCHSAGTACFVKQDCHFKPGQQGRIPAAIWALKQSPNFRAARATRAASPAPGPTGKEPKCT